MKVAEALAAVNSGVLASLTPTLSSQRVNADRLMWALNNTHLMNPNIPVGRWAV